MDSVLPSELGSPASGPPGAPRVSVILPTHNRASLLDEALESIAAQRFDDLEIVVVDDASMPPVDLERLARRHPKVRGLRHDTPRGGAAAKNSGIASSRGEILAFLDDDDLYDAGYLERSLAMLERYPELDVLFMGVGWFGRWAEHGQRTQGEAMMRTLADAAPAVPEPGVFLFDDRLLPALLRRVPMPFQRPVVRRSALEGVGGYRPDCLLWDCEWALRAAMILRCGLLDEALYRQRSDGQGFSSRGRERDHLESGFEMTRQLYRQPPIPVSAATRALLRAAASRGASDLAYYHSQRGEVRACIRAFWMSMKIQRSIRQVKLPLAAIARSLGFVPER